MSKVLVLGPGRKTRGGISTVIKEYEQTEVWKEYNCKWIGTYVDRNNFFKLFYLTSGFFRYITSIIFHDIIHIHISWSTTAVRKLPFFVLAKILNKKVVLHIHSAAEPIINSKRQFPYKYMFKHADVSVFLANRIKNEIQKNYKVKNSIVIYNPCLNQSGNLVKGITERKKQIIFAGTITEKKGYIDLIQAFAKVAPKYKEWTLIFAGNGEIGNARRIAQVLDIDKQIVFKGWIDRDELQTLLSDSAIFCLPSYTEGFPMAVLDAWAQGLPVIATPVGGLADVLINEENSLVFNPGDINTLAVQIETLINSEARRESISKESIKMSMNTFNIDTIAKQLKELYVTLT